MSCNSSRISTRMKGWSPWFPPSKPVNKDQTQNWSNFSFLFIILQFLHGFCSLHIVLFLNKMKLTMGSMLIWRVSCAIIWDNYGQKKTKLVDYPIRTSLFFICRKGGVVFVSRLTWTCQTEKKVCLKGKKKILMQNDTTLLRQVFGINLNIHVQYSTVIKSCMLQW